MTPAQVRAVIAKMRERETDADDSAIARAYRESARILAEALAESEAAPVWCEKFGPKGYACVIRHAPGTPHESRNAAGDVIDTWGP